MKPMIIALTAVGFATHAFAQGTLVFANLASGVNAPAEYYFGLPPGTPSGQRVTHPVIVADLYFSTNTNAPTDSLQAAGFNVPFSTTTSGGGGGYFLGGTRTVPGATGFIKGQVRVWDSRSGATFEEARLYDTPLGVSNPFIVNLAIPPAPAPPMAGLNPIPVFGFIPEPSTLSLGTLGLGILLILRHRKSQLSWRDPRVVALKNRGISCEK